MSAEPFRLRLEPHQVRQTRFSLSKSAASTILSGWLGSACLIPTLVHPLYGIYSLLRRYVFLSESLDNYLTLLLSLLQAFSLGLLVGLLILRFLGTNHFKPKPRSTGPLDSVQQTFLLVIRISLYFFIAALYFEYLFHSRSSKRSESTSLCGISNDIRDGFSNSARPCKGVFLQAFQSFYSKLESGPRIGMFEIGPRTWD